MKRKTNLTLLVLLAFASIGDAKKILGLFPHPGISHFNVFKPVLLALAERGHDLEVASYFPNDGPVRNYKDLQFRGQNILTGTTDLKKFAQKSHFDYFTTFFELKKRGEEYCRTALNSPVIDEILTSHIDAPFELVITEFYNSDCMLGLTHMLNVPFVGLSSCTLSPWHYKRVGAIELVRGRTFYERWANWWQHKIVTVLYRTVQWTDNRLLAERFGAGRIPDVGEIEKNTSLILVNQHFALTGVAAAPPRLVDIGGVHFRESKQTQVTLDLEKILNSSEQIAYISWGSKMRINTLPEVKRNAIIDACSRLNLTIIWKWDDETGLSDPMENVHLRKWLPQQEVLCHKNVKVFFSHGGMLGVLEAVHCGVPMIVTPLYRDQFINAAAVEQQGIGTILPYEDITEKAYEILKAAMEPDILKNAQKVSNAFNNSTTGLKRPIDVAVWSVEYVLVTGGADLMRSRDDTAFIATSDWIFAANSLVFIVVAYLNGTTVKKIYLKMAVKHEKTE